MSLFPFATNLFEDKPRLEALVEALGAFLSHYLAMRFRSIDTHQFESEFQRLSALRYGRPLHELISEDNVVSFHAQLQAASLAERREFDRQHSRLEAFFHDAQAFCRNYNIVLLELERFCLNRGPSECVKLKHIAAPGDGDGPCDERCRCFFQAAELDEGVSTGEFCMEIARLIEGMVEKWVTSCESKIKKCFDLWDVDLDETSPDNRLAQKIRKALADLIVRNVSMVGLYTIDMDARLPHALQASELQELCRVPFNSEVRRRCEAIRAREIASLGTMKLFCRRDLPHDAEVVRLCVEREAEIVRFVRRTPRVLRDRPGFSSANLQLGFLESIVKKAVKGRAEAVPLLEQWRTEVGRATLAQLRCWLDECCGIMREQVIPESGFLPTLYRVRLPPPPWRTSDETWYQSDSAFALTSSRMKRSTGIQQQYLPIPDAVHAALRLISLVWEVVGHRELYEAFFQPGEVLSSIVRNAIFSERLTLQHTSMQLMHLLQSMAPGANYRRAVVEMQNFRKSPRLEVEIRSAMRVLCRFPLHEIVTAASEGSAIFDMTKERMLAHAIATGRCGRNWETTWVVRRAFQTALPIICQLRRESAPSPFLGVSQVAEAMLSVPAIREWAGSTPEIVLTHEDMKQGADGVVDELKRLSRERRVVRYGRLPPSQRGAFGSKYVFVVNGLDFRNLLKQNDIS